MTGTHIILEDKLEHVLARLSREYDRVIVPQKTRNGVAFKEYHGDYSKVTLDYIRTINNPVLYIKPAEITLYTYTIPEGIMLKEPIKAFNIDYEIPRIRQVLFAIHPCDAHAIRYLDIALTGKGVVDPYYKAMRDNTVIIVLECNKSDEYCFCESLGTHETPEDTADIKLAKTEKGILAKPLSDTGERIIKELLSDIIVEYDGEWPKPKPGNKIKIPEWKLKLLEKGEPVDKASAEKYVEKCVLCETCTNLCPTCFCSDIVHVPIGINKFKAVKRKASCQSRYYSMIAVEKVLLERKELRFKWRILHKYAFSKRMYGIYGCVGCGRCTALCPSKISIVEFINKEIEG